jgi:hypothetical protein
MHPTRSLHSYFCLSKYPAFFQLPMFVLINTVVCLFYGPVFLKPIIIILYVPNLGIIYVCILMLCRSHCAYLTTRQQHNKKIKLTSGKGQSNTNKLLCLYFSPFQIGRVCRFQQTPIALLSWHTNSFRRTESELLFLTIIAIYINQVNINQTLLLLGLL